MCWVAMRKKRNTLPFTDLAAFLLWCLERIGLHEFNHCTMEGHRGVRLLAV